MMLLALGSPLALGTLVAAIGEETAVDFVREVRPILSDRCFPCHGPDAGSREGGFRLDLRDEAVADLGGYAAVVPGDPDESELVYRILTDDDDLRMPPAGSHLALTASEAELLRRWVAEGAPYAGHWSFEPPRRPAPPAVRDAAWPRDELDRFVLARLEREGLAPAPAADRATWLRRASFDLTGLPPALDDVEAFLADREEGAFGRAADRLLASPAYGERMAADWLELARYADTYGYQNDAARAVWPWRDWVIDAFNENLPYDRFVTWQLAGDLLDAPTRAQRLATTFNRLHRQTNEGGSVEEEFRVEYVSDRVHTFGMAFLGLTLECARCHDHKFDPLSQREYYGLSAFFDNVDESGLYPHFTSATPTPALALTTAEDDAELARLDAEIARVEAELARAERPATPLAGCVGSFSFDAPPDADGRLPNAADPAHAGRVRDAPRSAEGRRGLALEFSGEDNATFPGVGELRRWDPFTFSLWIRPPGRAAEEPAPERAVVLHRSRAWTDAGSCGYQLLLEHGRPSFSLIHFWPGDALRVVASDPLPAGTWTHVAITYDGSSRADGVRLYVDGRAAATEVVRDGLRRDVVSGGGLVLTLAQRFRDVGFAGGRVDELAVFERALAADEVALLFAGADPTRAPEIATDSNWWRRREELRELRRQRGERFDGVPSIMTMEELDAPRTTYVLARGDYGARGEAVEPHVPEALGALAADAPRDRLGLVDWLTAADNPLFARVAANRLWQLAFGAGLVATSENFGSQGTLPTHPELLDYLAGQLVDGGYDLKALMRRLVLSATYRQSSRAAAALRERDPENHLYARAPSRRLTGEELRDLALAASGLLVERVGGPSVKPYQPAGLWKEKSGAEYRPDEGEGLWRRSLYTFWKRTSPPPSMMIFDAGKREVCVARREETNTPLQVLVLWNDPQRVEAARRLAERVLVEAAGEDEARITRAFRLLATRSPRAEELDVLLALLAAERDAYRADPQAARALLEIGSASVDVDVDADADAAELAALTVVAGALLSYDAVVTKR
ncbi:MAG: DUF1553 domain-containing protein [Planctomycetota bacterium]